MDTMDSKKYKLQSNTQSHNGCFGHSNCLRDVQSMQDEWRHHHGWARGVLRRLGLKPPAERVAHYKKRPERVGYNIKAQLGGCAPHTPAVHAA